MQSEIPDKLYFKIGEVSKNADVAPHVLRYWESEFQAIRPKRANSKQRLYRRSDVELILKIKTLLESGQFGKIFMIRRRHGLPMPSVLDRQARVHINLKGYWSRSEYGHRVLAGSPSFPNPNNPVVAPMYTAIMSDVSLSEMDTTSFTTTSRASAT